MENKKWKKECKNKISILIFFIHNILCHPLGAYKTQTGAEKSLTEILLERKKNGQIKGLISNMSQYNLSYLILV